MVAVAVVVAVVAAVVVVAAAVVVIPCWKLYRAFKAKGSA